MFIFRQLEHGPYAFEIVVNIGNTSYPVTVHDFDNYYHITRQDGTVIEIQSDWQLGDPMMSANINNEDVTIHVRESSTGIILV